MRTVQIQNDSLFSYTAAMHRGFTLIEILISIFILAVASTVFLLIFQAKETTIRVNNLEKASVIAQKEIENLRNTQFANLPSSGAISDPQLSELPNGWAERTMTDYQGNPNIKSIHVVVSWLTFNATTTYVLDTLISK